MSQPLARGQERRPASGDLTLPRRTEIHFPVIRTRDNVLLLQFTASADRDLFKQWLTKDDGWSAFGHYVDLKVD
jgi:hypothetical protein